jgi:hypothetical protein
MSKFIPVCLICNKEYYSKVGLTMHLNKEHSKEEMVKAIKTWGITVN